MPLIVTVPGGVSASDRGIGHLTVVLGKHRRRGVEWLVCLPDTQRGAEQCTLFKLLNTQHANKSGQDIPVGRDMIPGNGTLTTGSCNRHGFASKQRIHQSAAGWQTMANRHSTGFAA